MVQGNDNVELLAIQNGLKSLRHLQCSLTLSGWNLLGQMKACQDQIHED